MIHGFSVRTVSPLPAVRTEPGAPLVVRVGELGAFCRMAAAGSLSLVALSAPPRGRDQPQAARGLQTALHFLPQAERPRGKRPALEPQSKRESFSHGQPRPHPPPVPRNPLLRTPRQRLAVEAPVRPVVVTVRPVGRGPQVPVTVVTGVTGRLFSFSPGFLLGVERRTGQIAVEETGGDGVGHQRGDRGAAHPVLARPGTLAPAPVTPPGIRHVARDPAETISFPACRN